MSALAQAALPQQQFKQVGDYVYRPDVDRVGRGSFATVYKACRIQTGEKVAIKRINITRLKKRLKENLELEIAIMKRMHHPNIVKLYDTLESAEHMYLVMEFCNNGDLSKYIVKHKPIEERIVHHIAQQIASALMHLGQHNIIHRDIKPQNVLLQRAEGTPSGFMAKVADFGFARYLESEMAATLCGSPLYMAPEILDSQPYGRKADLWSVGAVLYECAAGRPPFKAGNYIELSNVIKRTSTSLPMPSGISPAFEDLLRRLLVRNPDDRIAVEQFFQHEWLQLEVYQASIEIGPDDEELGPVVSMTQSPPSVSDILPLDVVQQRAPATDPILPSQPPVADSHSPSLNYDGGAQKATAPLTIATHRPVPLQSLSSGKLSSTPPSLPRLTTLPAAAAHFTVSPPTSAPLVHFPMTFPPSSALVATEAGVEHRAITPTFSTHHSPPNPNYFQPSFGSIANSSVSRRHSQPSVNPFRMPRHSSATSLHNAELARVDEGGVLPPGGGESYVIVDKDYVEVNAYADALDLNKHTSRVAPDSRPSEATYSASAPSPSPMASLAHALNAATTYTTQRLFALPTAAAHAYPPLAEMSGAALSFHEESILQDVEDHVRQAQSMMWLASKYADPRQTRSSAFLATSSSSFASPSSQYVIQAQACALALYIRALKQYRRGLDKARSAIPTNTDVSTALNAGVQRLRERYNACLEVAEALKARMLAVSTHADFRAAPRPNADKLLFDAAMRLCREAAACELLSENAQAERQYKHAFNLLAALVTPDADPTDLAVLQQYIRNIYKRLELLRQRRSSGSGGST